MSKKNDSNFGKKRKQVLDFFITPRKVATHISIQVFVAVKAVMKKTKNLDKQFDDDEGDHLVAKRGRSFVHFISSNKIVAPIKV
jgi:hypothetical protein